MKKVPVIKRGLGWRCNRCGYAWLPMSDRVPKTCPSCNSPYWNKRRQHVMKKPAKRHDEK